jgi:hypothetical protein
MSVDAARDEPERDIRDVIRSFRIYSATVDAISRVERVAGDLPPWARVEMGLEEASTGAIIPLTLEHLEKASRRETTSFQRHLASRAAHTNFAFDVVTLAHRSLQAVPDADVWELQSPIADQLSPSIGLISNALETTRYELSSDIEWLLGTGDAEARANQVFHHGDAPYPYSAISSYFRIASEPVRRAGHETWWQCLDRHFAPDLHALLERVMQRATQEARLDSTLYRKLAGNPDARSAIYYLDELRRRVDHSIE